jgi:Domain of unknown function (DUF4136)
MKKIAFIWITTLLIVTGSALGQDVRYNFDKDTDFSKLKTYQWVIIKGAQQPDDITDKQIKAAVDAELLTKGLSKTDSTTPDLYLGYQVAIQTEKQFTSFSSGMGGWGYGPGWYGGGWYGAGGGITTGETSTIYVGALVLDMYNVSHEDLIWRGVASKSLDAKAKPDKRQKNLNKAVAKLLKNYPPKSK